MGIVLPINQHHCLFFKRAEALRRLFTAKKQELERHPQTACRRLIQLLKEIRDENQRHVSYKRKHCKSLLSALFDSSVERHCSCNRQLRKPLCHKPARLLEGCSPVVETSKSGSSDIGARECLDNPARYPHQGKVSEHRSSGRARHRHVDLHRFPQHPGNQPLVGSTNIMGINCEQKSYLG